MSLGLCSGTASGSSLQGGPAHSSPRPAFFLTHHPHPLLLCSKRIADYPNLSAWMRDMWQIQVEGSSLQVGDEFVRLWFSCCSHDLHSSSGLALWGVGCQQPLSKWI